MTELVTEDNAEAWLAMTVVCPHCAELSGNVSPIECIAIELPCGHWTPLFAIGWIVEGWLQ